MSRRPLHFSVTAHRRGECPRYLDLIAFTPADAIRTAQELFPGYLLTLPAIAPMWREGA